MSDYIKNGGYTGHAWQGERYEASKSMDIAEIAKAIRVQIKETIAKGELPKGKYSVTIERFSGGQSLRICIKEFEFPVMSTERMQWDLDHPHEHPPGGDEYCLHSKIARMTREKLEAMVNAYRFDDSDGMIDYFNTNFYKSVDFDWKLESAEREAFQKSKAT